MKGLVGEGVDSGRDAALNWKPMKTEVGGGGVRTPAAEFWIHWSLFRSLIYKTVYQRIILVSVHIL